MIVKRLRNSPPTEAIHFAYQMDSTVILESFMFLSEGSCPLEVNKAGGASGVMGCSSMTASLRNSTNMTMVTACRRYA